MRAATPRLSPVAVYLDEVHRARRMARWRLVRLERRLARRHGLNPWALARWAAVRAVLRELGVDLHDA